MGAASKIVRLWTEEATKLYYGVKAGEELVGDRVDATLMATRMGRAYRRGHPMSEHSKILSESLR